MKFTIIATLIFFGCAVFLVHYFVTSPKVLLDSNPAPINLPVQSGLYTRAQGTLLSKYNQQLSDLPLLEHNKTTEVEEGFYRSTNDNDVFSVYYLESTGNLTITLYDEDTKAARVQAEEYIKDVLPYSESELCLLDVTVITNEYVNPTYAGLNLGFSFCPGTVVIP
jgi:hypothetical protein